MIFRGKYLDLISKHFKIHPIVALLGPRQSGKTTLARHFQTEKSQSNSSDVAYFDLEDPDDWQALLNPKTTLSPLKNRLIIIDEIQRMPDLFPYLRVLVDNPDYQSQFLILGSASRDLIQQSSETLAGRIGFIEVTPFNMHEIDDIQRLHMRGGFPKAYLAEDEAHASLWLEDYIRTFLERDIPMLGFNIPATKLRRFWHMISHYHGNMLNYSDLARSLNVSDNTIRHYLDLLCDTFMVRQLQPWYENIQKRQVKRPKIYIRDSGIFHRLLSIEKTEDLLRHPKVGASWEGFCVEQVIAHYGAYSDNCYFWGVHQQAELDLLLHLNGKRHGFEFKFQDAPKRTASMEKAVEVLQLSELKVIYPGSRAYQLSEKIEVIPLSAIIP